MEKGKQKYDKSVTPCKKMKEEAESESKRHWRRLVREKGKCVEMQRRNTRETEIR